MKSLYCIYDMLQKARQTLLRIRLDMDAQDTPPSFRQHTEVAERLRGFDQAKSVFMTWHWQISRRVACYLQE